MLRPYKKKNMKKIFTTYEKLCKLPLGWSLWGLLFFLIFATACTNDVAEVNTSQQQEQYVTVRMNVPGMQTSISRAAEDNITSITALSYDSNNKLTKKVSATNLNTENQTFNITVPNGTKNIHFLANNTVSLPEIGTDVSVLTSLTTDDYNNLCYWGMATTSDGNTNPLSVTLCRNLAKISIKPSEAADAFNDFTQEQLIIHGLMNANRNGKLIPFNGESFYSNQNGTAPDYLTLPDYPNPLDKTPEGNNGAGYGYSLYVLEHDNPKEWDKGLYVICKIGGAYYKVALVGEDGEPYDIIRNHEYIIYVSDVDDYAYDSDYRAEIYSDAFDKKPINLDVEEVVLQNVTFDYQDNQTLQVGGDPLTVTMTVPNGGTLNTLTISAPGFTIKQDESELGTDSYNGTDLNHTNTTITYTFVPNIAGRKTITFSNAQGTNLNISSLPVIEVTVNATIIATPTQQTIYYDGNNKSFNVSVNIPKGVNALSIDGAGSFIVTRQSQNGTLDDNTYTPNNTNGQTAVFTFTYNGAQSESTQTITFKDASNNPNVTGASVTVSVKKTETEEPVLVEGENNLPLNNLPLTLQNNNGEVLLKASGNNENGLLESYRTYLKEGVTLKITFTFDGDTNPLSFQTTWSGAVEGVFSQIDSNKYLSYTFKSSDFDKGDGGVNTIANAGLKLQIAPNSTATITAISIIIPASTP